MSNLDHRYFCSRSVSEVHLKMLHLVKKAQYTFSVLHSKLVTNENINSLLKSGESLLVSLSSIEGQSTFTRSLFRVLSRRSAQFIHDFLPARFKYASVVARVELCRKIYFVS